MFGRDIFRKTALKKRTVPENLDELLQVNSPSTWLLFTAISLVIIGLLIWGFLGSITQNVTGFGIIKTHELPRKVVAIQSGQIDSVFCNTGDKVSSNQRLMLIYLLEKRKYIEIAAPFNGEIIDLSVKEGTYVETGFPILEMIRKQDYSVLNPEVIFYIPEQEISKLKINMKANLEISKGGIPSEYLTGTITFIADYPASLNAIQKYFPDGGRSLQLKNNYFYEVRAPLDTDISKMTVSEKEALYSLNGLSCQTVVTIAKRSPVAFLLN